MIDIPNSHLLCPLADLMTLADGLASIIPTGLGEVLMRIVKNLIISERALNFLRDLPHWEYIYQKTGNAPA